MVNGFLQYIRYEKNFSSHTVLSYTNDLMQFLQHIAIEPSDFRPGDISALHIQNWIVELMNQKMSALSISRKISTLKSFWRYLEKYSLAEKNPTLNIILPKTKKPLPVFFKHGEVMRILDDPFIPDQFEQVRDLLIIEMFYMTGIRLSELITIDDKDVDIVGAELRVTGKRNKQRIIPLHESVCDKLIHYIKLRDEVVETVSPAFFVRKNGLRMYPKQVYNIVHRLMSQVTTLPKVSPHVLRHSFATGMLNGGADINAVRELLGHTSLTATQVYTHTEFGELNKIYKRAHPRAK